ncbi:MAG: glycoside hydrolase family 99-like domain-containing protein [Janthinobacterium lividum]
MASSSRARRVGTAVLGGLLALLPGASVLPAAAPAPLRLGVNYFPGWDGDDNHNWDAIRPYADDRAPLLGWYKDADPAVMRQQVAWMKAYGLSYVAFDWYWQDGDVHSDGAINAYLTIPQPGVDFAIMWANDHTGIGPDEWRRIVSFWIDHYLRQPNYLRLNGRPVVFLLTQQGFNANALAAKSTPTDYIRTAQEIARQAGIGSIAFVAGFDDLSYTLVTNEAPAEGYGAVSSYNLHRPPWRPQRPGWDKLTQGYPALDQAYRANWNEGLRSKVPVVLPMTTGWDKRPWGGSADPLHDRSVATPAQFRAHLEAARQVMLKPGAAHSGLGIVCCWNEYGEGSFLEPTQNRRFAMLEQVKAVFGKR